FVNDVIREEQLSDAEKARRKKIEASETVAKVVGGGPWLAKCIRKWTNICMKSELIQNFRGKFPSKSLLNDELVSLQVATYLRSQKFKVNPIVVKNYVENQVLPQLNGAVKRISIRTIRRWMHKLGFRYKRYQKGVYIDGHERLDVVAYRQTFLQEVAEYDRFMSKWHDESCKIRTFPELIGDEKEHIWVTHDESTFFTYDGMHAMWGPEGEQPLRKKELGLGVHVSDFLTETIGPLRDNLEEARAIMVLGSRNGGFWDTNKLLNQVQRAINIFERTHPGCI
ncbi:14019_t:CDS:2, partial [Gigaspora rosea]